MTALHSLLAGIILGSVLTIMWLHYESRREEDECYDRTGT